MKGICGFTRRLTEMLGPAVLIMAPYLLSISSQRDGEREREIAGQLEACLKMLFASKVSRGLKVGHSNRPAAIKDWRGRGGGTINKMTGRCAVTCTLTSYKIIQFTEKTVFHNVLQIVSGK